MKKENKPLILFHSGCPDGSASAMVAYMKYGENGQYIPVQYKQHRPADSLLKGRKVFVLDMCYPREDIAYMNQICDLLVLDHHKTSAEMFEKDTVLPVHFNMKQSGATMAYDYFFPDEEPNEFLLYIEDTDLWRKKMPQGEEISLALKALGGVMDFKKWIPYFLRFEEAKEGLIDQGCAIKAYIEETIKAIMSKAHVIELGGQKMNAVNTSSFMSEIGHRLSKEHGVAAMYHWVGKQRQWAVSLRSAPGHDCGKIAQQYGGGGHAESAAFRMKELPWKLS